MESNGKSITKGGQHVNYQTGVRRHRRLFYYSLTRFYLLADHMGRCRDQRATLFLPTRAPRHEAHPCRLSSSSDDAEPDRWELEASPNSTEQLLRATGGSCVW